jgi:acyl-lipid omega-6 desaturase (Delta-12 desaturase)
MAGGWYSVDLRDQAKRLTTHCRSYCVANDQTAVLQLAMTLIPLISLFAFMFWLASVSTLAVMPFTGLAGLFLVRVFAIQHDCGHGSFLSSRSANDRLGQILSVLTFTPYEHWRNSHARHHAGSGNLDRRGIGDIETCTIAEFVAMSPWQQRRYRLMRHPLVCLIIGPPVYFLLLQRFAFGSQLPNGHTWRSVILPNASLALFYAALVYAFGWQATLTVMLPSTLIATWIGGFLFYVQHQFEETMWEGADEWDVKIAALKGSSHLLLPRFLNWFTCDIGLHHIHHLNSRIPNYRLRDCLREHPEMAAVAPTLTLRQCFATANLALWDETTRKLVTFKEFSRSSTG